MKAWLGLGANMQQPVERVKDAMGRLAAADDIEVLRTSSFYRTAPWGDEHQDEFINAVAEIDTSLEPLPLLHFVQTIENDLGRHREARRWGPRVIDIDLLLYGDIQSHSAELDLPHPRMHERAFVLVPVAELDANLQIPGHGLCRELLGKLDCGGVHRLDGANPE